MNIKWNLGQQQHQHKFSKNSPLGHEIFFCFGCAAIYHLYKQGTKIMIAKLRELITEFDKQHEDGSSNIASSI